MNIYDTRFFIELYLTEEKLSKKKKLKELAREGGMVSTITLHEFYKINLEIRGKEVASIRHRRLVETYDVMDVTETIARQGAEYRKGKKIPMADALIAATASERKAIVVSDDPHFKEIERIKTKWV